MSDRCHGNHCHIDTLSVCISGEYNLMITPLELENDGVYECQIGATATTVLLISCLCVFQESII